MSLVSESQEPKAAGRGLDLALTAEESGTAPGDRAYRPDVEGLRAVAVVLVVLFHSRLGPFSGGFVGVDVFYVISGFVITGLLLRQAESPDRPGRGRIRFADFYARRCRRILPAAGLVLLVTIFASYRWLGFIRGSSIADDARWCAGFLGNFHFLFVGTNYLSSQLPPSPLQNYWSLGVEEQFYIVYPALLALALFTLSRLALRKRVMVVTGAVVAISLAWSIYQTSVDPSAAYFSSLTRAWELGLGGFVAAGTQYWLKAPKALGAVLAWVGVGCVITAALVYSSATSFPGYAALLPVGGAGLIILGGTTARLLGPEAILGTLPFRWVGRLSYSFYLWSWPLLTMAEQSSNKPLSSLHRGGIVLISLGAAALTYLVLENPVRHSKWLARSWWKGLLLGALIIAAVIIVATIKIHTAPSL